MVVSKKDKMILLFIFLIGQAAIFFDWFGWPINTYIGIQVVFFNVLYAIGWGLYLYALWGNKARFKVKLLPYIYMVFLVAAVLDIYVWWRMADFFIGGLIIVPSNILPGYYLYVAMMLISFIVHELYVRKLKKGVL